MICGASLVEGHRDVAGVYFSYGNSNSDVTGLVTNPAATAYVLQHTGTLNLNAYSGGGYWTHYGPGGWYLDGVLQGTGYTGTATAQSANFPVSTKLTTGGSGFLGSLEGGYPVPLPFGPNFILEPQAQIIWQHVSFDPADDGISTIALGSTSGTTGRLGARAQWTIIEDNGAVWQPYARANVWHSWGAEAETTFARSSVQVPLVQKATWLDVAGGVTYKLNPGLAFYAQAGYQWAVAPSNVSRDGFVGDIGLRFTFGAPPPPPPAVPAPPPPPPMHQVYTVFFDWDKYNITPEGMQILEAAAAHWKAGGAVQIQVTGYTDLSGSAAYNQRLSERRANAVATALERLGIARNEMIVSGRGMNDPRLPTPLGVREPQNRRVEIVSG